MIIDLNENKEVVLFVKDPSKPDEYIFVYKLIHLESTISDNLCPDIYVAVPNGHKVSVTDLPGGCYYMEKMNKE